MKTCGAVRPGHCGQDTPDIAPAHAFSQTIHPRRPEPEPAVAGQLSCQVVVGEAVDRAPAVPVVKLKRRRDVASRGQGPATRSAISASGRLPFKLAVTAVARARHAATR